MGLLVHSRLEGMFEGREPSVLTASGAHASTWTKLVEGLDAARCACANADSQLRSVQLHKALLDIDRRETHWTKQRGSDGLDQVYFRNGDGQVIVVRMDRQTHSVWSTVRPQIVNNGAHKSIGVDAGRARC